MLRLSQAWSSNRDPDLSDFTEMALCLVVISPFVSRPTGKITGLAIVALLLHSSGVSRFHIDRVIEFTSLLEMSLGLLVNFQVTIGSAGKITRLAVELLSGCRRSPARHNWCNILRWVLAEAVSGHRAVSSAICINICSPLILYQAFCLSRILSRRPCRMRKRRLLL